MDKKQMVNYSLKHKFKNFRYFDCPTTLFGTQCNVLQGLMESTGII